MNVFKNKAFTARNYECTNVVACTVAIDRCPDGYEPAGEEILEGLTQLYMQFNKSVDADVRYFGYL